MCYNYKEKFLNSKNINTVLLTSTVNWNLQKYGEKQKTAE